MKKLCMQANFEYFFLLSGTMKNTCYHLQKNGKNVQQTDKNFPRRMPT